MDAGRTARVGAALVGAALVSLSLAGAALASLSLAAGAPNHAAALDVAADDPVALDVMTFNVRTAIGRDGDNAWPHRRALVAEIIASRAPHVAGLQEALDAQIEYLAAELPDYRWLGVDRGLNGGVGLSEYTPIFYRHADLSPIESGTFWLSDTPDRPTPGRRVSRIVTWARFHHRATGRSVHVFNTHLTLRRGRRQVDSARVIAARVAAVPDESAVVVTGDFNNVAETSETWRVLTRGRLADAWLAATERRGPPLTAAGFGPPPAGRSGRIDWILVGGPVTVRSAETVIHEGGGRYPSDHYPVVARLEIAGQAGRSGRAP